MEIITLATKDVHELAGFIGQAHGLTREDVEFLTDKEIVALSHTSPESSQLATRKRAFFIQKDRTDTLQCFYGDTASNMYRERVTNTKHTSNTIKGMGASVGHATGKVYIVSLADPNLAAAIAHMPKGAILVSESTQPHIMIACHKAGAIVTDEGGILSHAAIIARELHIPCVVGTKIATETLETGQAIEVDGEKGIVTIIDK